MTDIESAIVAHVLYVNADPMERCLQLGCSLTMVGNWHLIYRSKRAPRLLTVSLVVPGLQSAGNTVGGIASKVDTVDLDADALGLSSDTTFRAGDVVLGRFAILPHILVVKMGPGLQSKAEEVSKTNAALSGEAARN